MTQYIFTGTTPPFCTDRQERQGGGVLCFVKDKMKVKQWPDLADCNHETLWLTLHPCKLPRQVSCLILGVIYHPPNADNFKTYRHISYSLDHLIHKTPRSWNFTYW